MNIFEINRMVAKELNDMVRPMTVKVFLVTLILMGIGAFAISCSSPFGEDDDDGGVRLPTPVYPSPYSEPSVSPDGQYILFRREKVTRIRSNGAYSVDFDSIGVWIANSDGSNMRLILQGSPGNPSLSPNGQWLLFEAGAQIYKALFDGAYVDSTGIFPLTNEGRNFFPCWSPEGERIAYDRTSEPRGIWIMNSSGENKIELTDGRMPCWSPDGMNIIFVGLYSEVFCVNINDTSNSKRLTSLNQNNIYATDNRYPKYSPDGAKIAFTSSANGEVPQIWVMSSDGSNPHQLTSYGGEYPSWTPEGRIVYVHYNYRTYNKSNGTLWIMNADGSQKQQLTFNHGLELN